MFPQKIFVLLAFFLIEANTQAQTVKVKKEKSTIKGESMEGYAVELEGGLAEVNGAFVRYLKTMGKAKQSDFIILNEPNLNGLSYAKPLFGQTNENGKTATAWIGYNSSDWPKDDGDKLNKELEKVMRDFGIKFYRDKIQIQIDESVRATQAVEKQQQRLLNENKTLSSKLEDNKREKVQLEKNLENNKIEYETLLKRIEQNKKAQDSIAVAAEQVKKVVDLHRDRQRKVN